MPAGPLRQARFVTVPSYHIPRSQQEATEAEVQLQARKLGVRPEDVRRTMKVVVPNTDRGRAYHTWFWTSPWHWLYYRSMTCCSRHVPLEPHLMDQHEMNSMFGTHAALDSGHWLFAHGHPKFTHLLAIWHRVSDPDDSGSSFHSLDSGPSEQDIGDFQTTESRPEGTWASATRASGSARRRTVRPAGLRP